MRVGERDGGSRDSNGGRAYAKGAPVSALPALSIDDFKGAFSFDEFFKSIVADVLPSLNDDESRVADGNQGFGNGSLEDSAGKGNAVLVGQPFAEATVLLPLCKDARSELVELCYKVDSRLERLKDEVANYDMKHEQKFVELDNGVAGLFESFSRLDSRISGVGQTAARIGDHLQNADAQRDAASQTIDLIKYLMEFNGSPGDLMELSALFTDDARVAEAAAVAQKLRLIAEEGTVVYGGQGKSTTNVTPGLEVAVSNLQDYCNELENRLLVRFDAASQKWDLPTMAECAKILSQFNRGSSAMQRYVASRPMFMDSEIMNLDARTVRSEFGPGGVPNLTKGLQTLYKEITETVRKEAATVAAVFPSPDAVMSILVQRVMEQRVDNVLAMLLPKSLLTNPIPMEDGGYQQYLRMLAGAYEKTQELAKELHSIGCGDLDVEGLAETLFSSQREDYVEVEQASLTQLFQHKMTELKAGVGQPFDAAITSRMNSRNGLTSGNTTISVTIVGEFVQWNEEAVARCTLLTPQAMLLATNVRAIFLCLLDEVSHYTTDGLERAMDALNEAAQQRNLYSIGSTVSRRVAAAAATAAEAAAAADAGEALPTSDTLRPAAAAVRPSAEEKEDEEGEKSLRKSTRTSVVVKQAEREAQRAIQLALPKIVKKKKEGEEKKMTQEEMLLEAAQTEIQNRQSLETLLAREEEVKRKAIINKEVYSGPLVRFYSKGGVNILEFVKMAEIPEVISAKALPYPKQPICVVTGLPARYRDPKSGHPYATKEAFAILRERLRKGGNLSRDDSLEKVQRKRTRVEREKSAPGSRMGSVKIKFKKPERPKPSEESNPPAQPKPAAEPLKQQPKPAPPPPAPPLPRPMVEANEADFMLEDLEVSLPSNFDSGLMTSGEHVMNMSPTERYDLPMDGQSSHLLLDDSWLHNT